MVAAVETIGRRHAARLLLIGALALASAARAHAESGSSIAADLERLCRTVLCRKPAPVHLKLPEGEEFEMTPAAPTPIVSGGWITVYPDETVMVEARVEGGRLVHLEAVSEVRAPERTLIFQLKQEPTLAEGTGMVLKVESPFAGVIRYRLAMMRVASDAKLVKTSSCPLNQGKPVFESWPHPIYQILATDFRLVDPASKAAETCD